jgi:NADH pyrophosphatase NudC (nudix superfamily)
LCQVSHPPDHTAIVRDSSRGLELLVLNHPDYPEAGTQIPADGVDSSESIEEAVLREVLEEPGLAELTLHRSPPPKYLTPRSDCTAERG